MKTVTLPGTVASAGAARRMVAAELAPTGSPMSDAVVLMTSELVANVIRHANTDVRVSIDVGPPIRVEVHNHLAATDAFREMIRTRPGSVPAESEGGRGLVFVHDLATRIGLDDDDEVGGKIVWFEVDAP